MRWTIFSIGMGIAGILFVFWTYLRVLSKEEGSDKMKDIASQIHLGAMVFLKREYQIIIVFMIIVFFILVKFINLWTGVTFLFGATCSMLAGLFGMQAATWANSRTCQAAIKGGISEALKIAFSGGSVMGITVASLGIVGIGIVFYFTKNPSIINGFAMGASSVALLPVSEEESIQKALMWAQI